MRTDEEIKDDIIQTLLTADIESVITGKVYSEGERPSKSTSEDIIISTLSTLNAPLQESFVNVNFYVRDLKRDNDMIRNRKRIRELTRILVGVLHNHAPNGFLIKVQSDKSYSVPKTSEHAVNIKLLITHLNY